MTAYFLIQGQFESPDRDCPYVESPEQMLCGHYKTCCFMLAVRFSALLDDGRTNIKRKAHVVV